MRVYTPISMAAAFLLILHAEAATTVSQVVSDIIVLDDSVKTLISAVEAYQGGLISETLIAVDFTTVAANTAKGGDDANNLPQTTLSTADTYTIINTVKSTLDIDNPAAITALESKKPFFQASGQDIIIQASLKLLLAEHLYFSNAVLERAAPAALADANTAVDIISNALQAGINAFAT